MARKVNIPTWDNRNCDLLLNHISPDEDEGVVEKQMYVTKGDTWVITTDAEGVIKFEQLTLEQAVRRVHRALNGPAWVLESMPADHILRLYHLTGYHLRNLLP